MLPRKPAVTALLFFVIPVLATPTLADLPRSVHSTDAATPFTKGSDKPLLGLGLSVGATGLGSQHLTTAEPGNFEKLPLRLQLDLQPLHFLGVFSLGASVEYYRTGVAPEHKAPGAVPSLREAYSVGAQARYQARLFSRQLIVPTAAYGIESFAYRLADSTRGSFRARGLTLGAWIDLGAVDRASARAILKDLGISRSYLTLERRTLEGADYRLSAAGSSYQVGLRVEI